MSFEQGVETSQREYLDGCDTFSPIEREVMEAFDLGNYQRMNVSNLDQNPEARAYFDFGLKLMLSYHHELAAKAFMACLALSPYCVLAHGFVALCHAPNYNFKGKAYYESTNHPDDVDQHDLSCIFPSQQVADRHSKLAIEKIEELKKATDLKCGEEENEGKEDGSQLDEDKYKEDSEQIEQGYLVSDPEVRLLEAIRVLTCVPGVDPDQSDEIVGRAYAREMRKVYEKYPEDPEIAYFLVDSLMVLNAWNLYKYPSGEPTGPDTIEIREILERALKVHPQHVGLCHLYVHLLEMSPDPASALGACDYLRVACPFAGHLVHMPTHIDVLVGDYESCIEYNCLAIKADQFAMKASPSTAGKESFYFNYVVHNYHMAVYGAILGGMEDKGMEVAKELNTLVNEAMFEKYPSLTSYLETYSALDIHVMTRFGRWEDLLQLQLPKDSKLMLYRTASVRYARGLALAALRNVEKAKEEADHFEELRKDPDAEFRILYNNTVKDLLAVDSAMLRGEIAYREGQHEIAFDLLRKAVAMQDKLNYDEPWGKMQPIRHALAGLLLEQGQLDESEMLYREDLKLHPNNPWALVGLIKCLTSKSAHCCKEEVEELKETLRIQREGKWADFDVVVSCECCQRK
jgi:tetratricopeptide (TPR) repeat protein